MRAFGDGEAFDGPASALNRLSHTLDQGMVSAEHSYRLLSIARQSRVSGPWGRVAVAAGCVLGVWLVMLAREIHDQSTRDEARAADVIVVMGAAE